MAAQTLPGMHFAILELGVSIWNQWRASEPLTVPNLQNTDLRGFHLENINFCRADLRNANLSTAYLYEADFQEADLRNANLTRAGLIGANLHRANLSGAIVEQAYLAQSDLSNANFTGAHLQKADFQAALLSEAVFVNARVAEAEFTTSFDLTRAQIACARGTHLACFDAVLSVQLGLPPQGLAKGLAEGLTEGLTKELAEELAEGLPDGLTDRQIEALAESNASKAGRLAEAFQLPLAPGTKLEPVSEAILEDEPEPRSVLHRLKRLSARRRTVVSDVGLS